MLQPSVAAAGLRLWGLQYLRGGKLPTLRVFIDAPGADEHVSVDDCERVSREISVLLDVEEVIPGDYTLEVSSPGMDRQLFHAAQYAEMIGEVLDVRLNYAFEGRKKFVGLLVGVEQDEAVLQIDQEEFVLPIELIQRARVVPQFDGIERGGQREASK